MKNLTLIITFLILLASISCNNNPNEVVVYTSVDQIFSEPILKGFENVYGTSKLPLVLDMIDFISIVIGSMIIVFLSSYYPAIQATKIDVLDVLRNE